ncbi:hypothetical protein OS493_032403, partial [Desmophyllum pertusum]
NELALRDIEPSKSTQPRSEYMDLNEATVDKSTPQSAAQGAGLRASSSINSFLGSFKATRDYRKDHL